MYTPLQTLHSDVQSGLFENFPPNTVLGLHTLTVGCSGAGKGSIFWGIAGGLGPAVKEGTALLLAIDLKYGIEVSVGSPLFTKVVTTEAQAAQLLTKLEKLLDIAWSRHGGPDAQSHADCRQSARGPAH